MKLRVVPTLTVSLHHRPILESLEQKNKTAPAVSGLLNAGAKAVVASLWNVEDASTTQLMEAFYQHLAANQDKAAALNQAKRELLNANPRLSPYYWAAFVLVGEGLARVRLLP